MELLYMAQRGPHFRHTNRNPFLSHSELHRRVETLRKRGKGKWSHPTALGRALAPEHQSPARSASGDESQLTDQGSAPPQASWGSCVDKGPRHAPPPLSGCQFICCQFDHQSQLRLRMLVQSRWIMQLRLQGTAVCLAAPMRSDDHLISVVDVCHSLGIWSVVEQPLHLHRRPPSFGDMFPTTSGLLSSRHVSSEVWPETMSMPRGAGGLFALGTIRRQMISSFPALCTLLLATARIAASIWKRKADSWPACSTSLQAAITALPHRVVVVPSGLTEAWGQRFKGPLRLHASGSRRQCSSSSTRSPSTKHHSFRRRRACPTDHRSAKSGARPPLKIYLLDLAAAERLEDLDGSGPERKEGGARPQGATSFVLCLASSSAARTPSDP